MIKYTLLQGVVRRVEPVRTLIFLGLRLKEIRGLTGNTTLDSQDNTT